MPDQPFISVVMPIYNGAAYLDEAITSVLSQTLREFELVVINDGSTDETLDSLAKYRRDPRVRIFTQAHQGLVAARNAGWRLARGKYIAWADADDICRPERLEKQLAFMEAHPDVGICGTWVQTIGNSAGQVWQHPTADATIRCRLLFESSLANPSVMLRRTLFTDVGMMYALSYDGIEDYDLWVRASGHCCFANLPEVLVLYRLHDAQTSQRTQALMRSNTAKVQRAQLKRLGLRPTPDEYALHEALGMWQFQATRDFVTAADAWLRKLKAANDSTGVYPEPAFSSVLAERWSAVCDAAAPLGLWTYTTFRQSPLSAALNLSWKQRVQLATRSLRCQAARTLRNARGIDAAESPPNS